MRRGAPPDEDGPEAGHDGIDVVPVGAPRRRRTPRTDPPPVHPAPDDPARPPRPARSGGRRRWARAAAAGAVAVALVVPALATGDDEPAPDRPTATAAPTAVEAVQRARPVGDAEVATLGQDVAAVNRPYYVSPTELAADDVAGFDVTVTVSGGYTKVVADGSNIGSDPMTATTFHAAPGAAFTLGKDVLVGVDRARAAEGGTHSALLVGQVPPDVADPRVVLLGGELPLPDGGTTPAVEVPTFVMPDGALRFVVVLRETAARRLVQVPHLLVFSSDADHSMRAVGCPDDLSLAECAEEAGVPLPGDDALRVASFTDVPAEPYVAPEPVPPDEYGSLPTDVPPAAPAPVPVALAAGVVAATGLSSAAGEGVDGDGWTYTYYLAGGWFGASVRVAVGEAAQPWFGLFAVRDGQRVGDESGQVAVDLHQVLTPERGATASTTFTPARDGVLTAGVTPPGAGRAFLTSPRPLTAPDGSQGRVLEIPTFPPPSQAAAHLAADQRMYVVGLGPPASDLTTAELADQVVFATDDGRLVDAAGEEPHACAVAPDLCDEVREAAGPA